MDQNPEAKPVILVVEDEPLIRMHAVDMIEYAGYEVIEAGNADEAIALLETNANIQVVFSDIDIPGSMDGLKLLAAVRKRWPPIKLIATSGHMKVHHSDLPENGHFISKPYRADQLAKTIRDSIAQM